MKETRRFLAGNTHFQKMTERILHKRTYPMGRIPPSTSKPSAKVELPWVKYFSDFLIAFPCSFFHSLQDPLSLRTFHLFICQPPFAPSSSFSAESFPRKKCSLQGSLVSFSNLQDLRSLTYSPLLLILWTIWQPVTQYSSSFLPLSTPKRRIGDPKDFAGTFPSFSCSCHRDRGSSKEVPSFLTCSHNRDCCSSCFC